jgi:hypothetical protein
VSWEHTWVLPWQAFENETLAAAAQATAAAWPGVRAELEPSEGRAQIYFWLSPEAAQRFEADDPEFPRRLEESGLTLEGLGEVPIEATVAHHPVEAPDEPQEQFTLRLRSNRSGNWVCQNAMTELGGRLAQELGGRWGQPDPPGPDDVTHDPLADLRRMLLARGEVPPAWVAAHAPDGDVDAALARLWAETHQPQRLIELVAAAARPAALERIAHRCVKAMFAEARPKQRGISESLRAADWYLAGKVLRPALKRAAEKLWWLMDQPVAKDELTRHQIWATSGLCQVLLATKSAARVGELATVFGSCAWVVATARMRDPDAHAWRPGYGTTKWDEARTAVDRDQADRVRNELEVPTLAALKRALAPKRKARSKR